MKRINLNRDIEPLSSFRANAASVIDRVRRERRPIVITQHGKGSAVLLDVGEYEKLMDTLDLLRDLSRSRQELDAGEGQDNQEVLRQLRTDYPAV